MPSRPGSFNTGLLVRCDAMASHRPSVAPSAWSFVVTGRVSTTPMARRRPTTEPRHTSFNAVPVECPV